jgi:hypothetical protein
MDWLRSEDLKEEKVVTAPLAIIAVDRAERMISTTMSNTFPRIPT